MQFAQTVTALREILSKFKTNLKETKLTRNDEFHYYIYLRKEIRFLIWRGFLDELFEFCKKKEDIHYSKEDR